MHCLVYFYISEIHLNLDYSIAHHFSLSPPSTHSILELSLRTKMRFPNKLLKFAFRVIMFGLSLCLPLYIIPFPTQIYNSHNSHPPHPPKHSSSLKQDIQFTQWHKIAGSGLLHNSAESMIWFSCATSPYPKNQTASTRTWRRSYRIMCLCPWFWIGFRSFASICTRWSLATTKQLGRTVVDGQRCGNCFAPHCIPCWQIYHLLLIRGFGS